MTSIGAVQARQASIIHAEQAGVAGERVAQVAPVQMQREEEAEQPQEDLPVRVRVDVVDLGHQLNSETEACMSALAVHNASAESTQLHGCTRAQDLVTHLDRLVDDGEDDVGRKVVDAGCKPGQHEDYKEHVRRMLLLCVARHLRRLQEDVVDVVAQEHHRPHLDKAAARQHSTHDGRAQMYERSAVPMPEGVRT